MKKSIKRFVSMLLVIAICCACSMAVFAEEPEEVPEGAGVVTVTVNVPASNEIPPLPDGTLSSPARIYDRLLSSAFCSFSYDGQASCVLGRNNISVGICASISSSSASGTVTCFVRTPNNTMHNLGTVSAAGGSTAISSFPTAPSGTYTFYFESTTSATLNGSGLIYQYWCISRRYKFSHIKKRAYNLLRLYALLYLLFYYCIINWYIKVLFFNYI